MSEGASARGSKQYMITSASLRPHGQIETPDKSESEAAAVTDLRLPTFSKV